MFEDINYNGLTGVVITPDDPDYDEARQEYNRSIQRYPLAIVYCLEVHDVVNAVRWARDNCVGLRIRNGGHNYEGYSVGNAVLVIDIGRLNSVRLNQKNRTVNVMGGANNRQVYTYLAAAEYPFNGGACPTVGVGGYAMGGGWNFFCRHWSLGCDSLLELKMVNYEGELLTANKKCNPNLYWACRGGGGGNFGVIVSMTFRLPKQPGKVTFFTIYHPDATAEIQEQFISTWQQWLPGLDPRMTLRPSVYHSSEEGRAIFSRGIFFGRPEEAAELLQPLIDSEGWELTTRYVPFAKAVQILGSVYPSSEMFKTTGRFVNEEFSRCEIRNIVSLLDELPEGLELIEFGLFAMGGRVATVAPMDTAFYYRDAQYILTPQAVWTDPELTGEGNAWVRQAFNVIKPLTVGSYVNFPYAGLINYERAYFGGNVPRLRAVKRVYDPENVFNYPQSIKP
jgi:FAD/FMN-containing dehydrogenase